ncbi:DcaP family trimeric outer membrane transporter [Microbulbifer sp. CAU 1566]|uniref:DcaP family trimeric outer membrane transporter n=1 Tax=Microbulbifer sp. CAU 1566 TaxID=2933269 RepID=UPI0020037949|nr:DcaP family trimeric outer membrane transporter [Microbulbifer sp. CAU 1566]MCK7598296.1 DcaP family trimeric outer membrane transporter [Microbulbifer sp. CAU 1566]
MSVKIIKSKLAGAVALAAMVNGLPALAAQSDELASSEMTAAQLQQRITELQAQVDQLAATQASSDKPVVENPEPPKTTTFGNTDIQIGGYIKLDSIFSDYSDGSAATAGIGEDFLVPSTIPIGGEGGDMHYNAHAKSTRLFFKSSTELGAGSVNTHLEIDAMAGAQGDERISNSYAQRLRHAYIDWNIDGERSLLAGQAWSTFFNVGTLPEGLDFVGPVGTVFERQPQIRYTQGLGSGKVQIAAENPATTLYNGTENPYDDNSRPDLILRYDNSIGDLNYSIASMSRELAYDHTDGSNESEQGYAISLAGKWQLGRDDLRFMYSYGNALGRYLGLNSYRGGIIDPVDGDIELIDQHGGYVALRHFWSDEWRSNLVLSATAADNPDIVSDMTPSSYQSLHLNLMYSPVPKMTLGGEYIFASKEVENLSGLLADDSGELQRLQFSVKYVF